jgi:hypothetical protein
MATKPSRIRNRAEFDPLPEGVIAEHWNLMCAVAWGMTSVDHDRPDFERIKQVLVGVAGAMGYSLIQRYPTAHDQWECFHLQTIIDAHEKIKAGGEFKLEGTIDTLMHCCRYLMQRELAERKPEATHRMDVRIE